MKILYIITQADGGGAQKYTLALAEAFGGSLAAGSEDSKLFREALIAGVETFPLRHLKRQISPLQDFLAIWEIRELIKNLKPDIVHLNSSKAGVLGSFAAIGLSARGGSASGGKTRVVFTAHGFVFNEPLPWVLKSFYLALEKVASSYRDFIITVSDADKKSALEHKLIAADKISTVHNGIPPIDFLHKDQAHSALGLIDGKFTIGTVANFYKTKGLDILIKSISLLDDGLKQSIQLVIIGDGPEKRNLELGIRNHGLQNQIKLLGKIDYADTYLKAFDLFVLPSRKEGFPYTLLEAMQAGLPIVATNVGGNPEALADAAILIQPEDPRALAEAIKNILADENKRKILSQKALERSKLFTQTKMLEETKKIYEKILKI